MEGHGTLLLSNGERVTATFKDGKVDGKGTFYALGGKDVYGTWSANKLVEEI
jgi:hypothetical protein